MTPQELRASILQQAIQGKLVTHYEDDQPVLANTSFSGDVSSLFDIPENWKWLSIKDVASVNTGLSFKKQDQRDYKNGSLRVLRGGNIGDDYKYHLFDDDVYVDLDQFQTKYIQLLEGDVITPSVTSMEKMCKTGYIDQDFQTITAGGFVYIIRCLNKSVLDPKYLLFFISSAFNKEQCKVNIHKSGQAFYNLKKSGFIEQPICVPPITEQKRIVAKLEEILPLIDRYEAAWNKLEEFNKRFPGDMQKSILQLAIQGKLVEQRPEEGTGEELFQKIQTEKQALIKAGKIKKQKPLPEITEDEIPFDIPDTWKWERLGNISWYFDAGKSPNCLKQPVTGSDWGVITTTAVQLGFFDDAQNKILPKDFTINPEIQVRPGDILITRAGPTNRTGIACLVKDIRYNLILSDKIIRINMTDSHFYKDYLIMVLNSPQIRNLIIGLMSGMDKQQVNVSQDKYKTLLIPIPPLAEQKRIVAKLEEILPLCDRLK